MATPHISTNFSDSLDPLFQENFWETYNELPDQIPTLYSMPPTNNRETMKWTQTGAVPNFDEFTGTVSYGSYNQGYDTTSTPLEFTKGIQAERKLLDDEQYGILSGRPKGLASAAFRTRQTHGAGMLENAFSVWTEFYNNTESRALCSNSHLTTSGASTNTGFDNLVTSALSATAVAAARIQMRGFRGDQAERISIVPNELWHPPNLYEEAYEIIKAAGKVDTDLNNPNVHQGSYTSHDWEYMDDVNNWFMMDGSMRKQMLHWVDRIALEFAFIEDFDKIIGKWRGYMRYGLAHTDWRFCLGANVS